VFLRGNGRKKRHLPLAQSIDNGLQVGFACGKGLAMPVGYFDKYRLFIVKKLCGDCAIPKTMAGPWRATPWRVHGETMEIGM
jgi:hypothetical protein